MKKKVRVAMRRNRSGRVRDKQWSHLAKDEAGGADAPRSQERVVPKGDLSRMRTVVVDEQTGLGDTAELTAGVVVTMRGLIADVDDGRRTWPCTIRRMLRTRLVQDRVLVTAGDRVWFSIVSDAQGQQREAVIEQVAARRSALTRVSGRRVHTVAANVDQAVIVSAAALPPTKPHMIDRYIVAALHGGMTPVICINKTDLDLDGSSADLLERYQRLGYTAIGCSTISGEGIDDLRRTLAGKASVLTGQSGVGKSSLLNAIEPDLALKVGQIVAHLGKGCHTTTTAQLIRLGFGGGVYPPGWVVDTPGIRTLDLSGVPRGEFESHFVEFVERLKECNFPDCTHTHETGCAIKAAVASGKILADRYASYVRMFEDPGTSYR